MEVQLTFARTADAQAAEAQLATMPQVSEYFTDASGLNFVVEVNKSAPGMRNVSDQKIVDYFVAWCADRGITDASIDVNSPTVQKR